MNNRTGIKFNHNKLAIVVIISFLFLLSNCNHSNPQDLKGKYSAEVINYFYETVFFQDYIGKKDKISKWNKDIHVLIEGDYSTNDIDNIKATISQLNILQLPVKIYLTPDSSSANLFIYYGEYPYLEEKLGFDDHGYELFVGAGRIIENESFIESAVVGFANNARKYKRINKADSIKLRHAITLEEITQCLGVIGDSWHYPNSIFYEGGVLVSEMSSIDKNVLQLLYESFFTTNYSRQEFENDFGDILYHIKAPQKIADYVLANNIQPHFLTYIREKCFHDSVFIKCPSEMRISLNGDFSLEDSLFSTDVIKLFNSVSEHIQLVFVNNIPESMPGINICYEHNINKGQITERQMATSTMMFPRRIKGEIKVFYGKQGTQGINRLIFNSIYKLLGFDFNNFDDMMELDSLGNISFKPDYKEMLALIYEPVFYSGLKLSEFDEALEILKANGYNNE